MTFTTRHDLTAVAARHAPTNACATAMQQRRAAVLGGFATPGTLPCWIVQVTSKRGRVWNIAIECDEDNNKYSIRYPETVPWADWLGDSKGKRPLIDGDDPIGSSFKRLRAVRSKRASAKQAPIRAQANHDDEESD